jgi:hypothetical protein
MYTWEILLYGFIVMSMSMSGIRHRIHYGYWPHKMSWLVNPPF